MSKKHSYITTPIYYGTAKPHLGSLYSTLIADVITRWQQLRGSSTYFLTGTDEHGQKIVKAAQEAGMEPKAFVDSFIPDYKKTWKTYNIDYTRFIRTTDEDHKKGVQFLVDTLIKKGAIYKGRYTGWYCTPCETFVVSADQPSPECPSCNRQTVQLEEETYFFKLSDYQDRLLAWYKNHPDFVQPHTRLAEVVSFVESGLEDLSISRTTISWGVPFPHDVHHIVYVWVDALCNYITAIGYGDPHKEKEFNTWWPAQVHVLGKDIIRFHAVYWPALLMAADLPLPESLLVHGWIQVDKQKMSKSRGNVVDPMELATTYGADQVRYYLMRYISVNTDGEFSIDAIEQSISSDLANDLGNVVHRMVLLADKHGCHTVEPAAEWNDAAVALRDAGYKCIETYLRHMNAYEFHLALAQVWKYISAINAYFHQQEPWQVIKKDPILFKHIISATSHAIYVVGTLLWPIMPEKMTELYHILGQTFSIHDDVVDLLKTDAWHHTFTLKKSAPLFAKIERTIEDTEATMQHKEEVHIGIDDLLKIDVRVGTIVSAESMPKSDKLIKLEVDLGDLGTRTILSGIRASFLPEDLVGKQGVFVVNLKPRKMMGLESHGMMLMAEGNDGKAHLVNPEGLVSAGTRLR